MLNLSKLGTALGIFLLLAACSESPKTEKAPEPLTGRQAFQRIYPQARAWAADATPLILRSVRLSAKPEKGKADAWEVTFASPSLGKSKTYTYSITEAEGNLHEGVFGAIEDSYSGHGETSPYPIAAIKIDSDQAYDVAAEKSADYIKKNPDKPISYILEQSRKFPDLTWRVIWGESVSSSNYSVYVDASTGKYLEKAY